MLTREDIKRGVCIELWDRETSEWLPLSIVSIVFDHVECRTARNEPIFTTVATLINDARPAMRQTLDAAILTASVAQGSTVLVLVSPKQAKRLLLALQIADKCAETNFAAPPGIDLALLAIEYKGLAK